MVTVAFLWDKLSQPQFHKDLTRKTAFFEEWSWLKFNNLGLALGTNLKCYASVAKGLKLKLRKFLGLILTFVEVTGEQLIGWAVLHPSSPSWIGLTGNHTMDLLHLQKENFKNILFDLFIIGRSFENLSYLSSCSLWQRWGF